MKVSVKKKGKLYNNKIKQKPDIIWKKLLSLDNII